jgi:hypothetical protein
MSLFYLHIPFLKTIFVCTVLKTKDMILSTTPTIEGHPIKEYKG